MVKHDIGDSVFKHELDLIAVNVQIWRAWELGLSLCQGPKIIIEVNATGEKKKKNGDSKVPVYFFLRFMVRYFACWAVHSLKIKNKDK